MFREALRDGLKAAGLVAALSLLGHVVLGWLVCSLILGTPADQVLKSLLIITPVYAGIVGAAPLLGVALGAFVNLFRPAPQPH